MKIFVPSFAGLSGDCCAIRTTGSLLSSSCVTRPSHPARARARRAPAPCRASAASRPPGCRGPTPTAWAAHKRQPRRRRGCRITNEWFDGTHRHEEQRTTTWSRVCAWIRCTISRPRIGAGTDALTTHPPTHMPHGARHTLPASIQGQSRQPALARPRSPMTAAARTWVGPLLLSFQADTEFHIPHRREPPPHTPPVHTTDERLPLPLPKCIVAHSAGPSRRP